MKIKVNKYAFDQPKRRPLQIFASDPMARRGFGNHAIVTVENEDVEEGPSGSRIRVVDFNATTGKYYPAVDLNDPNLLMQSGLAPTESDPRFHQQMVYAVAMRTLENFDRALGRRLHMTKGGKPLRLFPHAFHAANAFFDPELHAVLFGYFRADESEPGDNLPGQTVFTCLSHDIIAHEVTHAIVHRLRPDLLEPSNIDVLAFHEAFADLVALFQHFSFTDVLKSQILSTGSNLREAEALLGVANQFGHATSMGRSLRSALNNSALVLHEDLVEPHERGAVLVAAVFDAFIKLYEAKTGDLQRLAAPFGSSMHPDLVARLANEAARLSQTMLTVCIRAFDYLPPIDVTFGDFLRAMVTADIELSPSDESGMRAALIDAFRLRGIYPDGVTSLAEESLVWEPTTGELPNLEWDPTEFLGLIVEAATRVSPSTLGARPSESEFTRTLSQYEADDEAGSTSKMVQIVRTYAIDNASELGLDGTKDVRALGVHPVFRVAPSGQLAIELVAQVVQATTSNAEALPLRGGTTLIVSFDGMVKYAICKPLPSGARDGPSRAAADRRAAKQTKFMEALRERDPRCAFTERVDFDLGATFKNLHLAR